MALIHPVLIMAIKCYGGGSLISAWSLKDNLITLSKAWKIYKILVFEFYKRFKATALKIRKN